MFSDFTRSDWLRITVGTLVAGLLAWFAEPVAGFMRGANLTATSVRVIAMATALTVASGLATAMIIRRLRTHDAAIRFVRITSGVLLLAGIIYVVRRDDLARTLGFSERGVDAIAAFLVALIAVRTIEVRNALRPSDDSGA